MGAVTSSIPLPKMTEAAIGGPVGGIPWFSVTGAA
jgi:hypothetical protein